MEYQLIDNEKAKQYEFHIERVITKREYIKTQNKNYLTHTEVPTKREGKGIGSSLGKMALEDIKKKELILVPLCPLVALYIKRHPEWKELVLKGINII